MRGRTFALSQKELQRVSVISSCVKGNMACARAPRLLFPRHPEGKPPKKSLGGEGRGGSGARQPRTAQPPSSAFPRPPSGPPPGPLVIELVISPRSVIAPSAVSLRGRFEREWRSAPVETPLTA